jgi:carnosine N-methyltransferase
LLVIILCSCLKTTPFQLAANNRRRKDLYTLPRGDQEILENLGYKQKLADVDIAIQANADFLNQIIENPEIFGHDLGPQKPEVDVDSMNHDDTEPNGSLAQSHGEYSPSAAFSSDSRFTNPFLSLSGHSRPSHLSSHSHSHSHSHDPHVSSHAHDTGTPKQRKKYKTTDFDMDKLRSTLKQLVRDWSEEVIFNHSRVFFLIV